MSENDRRDFIKHTAVAIAGGAWIGQKTAAGDPQTPATGDPSMPPRRALVLPGVHAYTGATSVAAGTEVEIHVSSTVGYRLSICRLGLEVDDPEHDEVLHVFAEVDPNPQPIYPGSFVLVDQSLPSQSRLNALTLECWLRPFRAERWAGLVSQHEFPSACGYGLFVAPGAAVAFYLGDGGPFRAEWDLRSPAESMAMGQWHHLVGTWDGNEKSLWINGKQVASSRFADSALPGPARLMLAAYSKRGAIDQYLDGDLAVPAIYERAWEPGEILRRYRELGRTPEAGEHALATWPLDEEQGDRVRDGSGNGRHGTIVNHATWMIGGPGFDANVPRFGDYQPTKDPRRGHALRFASDDLYDCGWEVTHRYGIPHDARSGIYVARFDYQVDGQPMQYHTTFIVKKSPRRTAAPILVLAATNTWRAYNGASFSRGLPPGNHLCGTGGFPNSEGDPPAFCFYRNHAAGQGTYQLGMHIPWPTAGPYVLYGDAKRTAYSHLARADRFFHIWLERTGYAFDVIADVDLHQQPDLLRDYKVVVINGHSEYWSIPMMEGLRRYLEEAQGNVICFSGNSLFWRVSFNEDCSIIECRKVDAPGLQVPPERRGECWHSQDGLRGGLLAECGYPGWQLVGLATLGWNNPNEPSHFGPFYVENPDHFLFNEPKRLELKKGDTLGAGPKGTLPAAGGHEVDVRVSTLHSLMQAALPSGAVHPVDPQGIQLLAAGRDWPRDAGATFDYFMRPVKLSVPLGGELIYWERPTGGRVLNAGAIGSGWALAADERFQSFVKNVLEHFGVPEPS
jgi:hypothetical protein